MSNDQATGKENEFFNYVEQRIDKLEELILKKDDELKALIVQATKKESEGLHRIEDDVLVKRQGEFNQVFKDIEKEEERFLSGNETRTAYKTEDLNEQLLNIEQREKLVESMLNSLEAALNVLKQRHEEVNRKEETLNQEYQRLQETEALYQKIEKMENQSSHRQNERSDNALGTGIKTPEKMNYKE